jgi:hypothetical protein
MGQLPSILAVPGERPQSKVKRSVKDVSAETSARPSAVTATAEVISRPGRMRTLGHERSFKEPVFKPLLKSAADLKAVSSEYFPELTTLTVDGS